MIELSSWTSFLNFLSWRRDILGTFGLYFRLSEMVAGLVGLEVFIALVVAVLSLNFLTKRY